jgi:acyl-[acyl carrier protein]--UDP-N-acetylglucosamine O-acyltransferase
LRHVPTHASAESRQHGRIGFVTARPHWFASIRPRASIDGDPGAGVEVAAIVEAGTRIGDRTAIAAHAFIAGSTDVGPDGGPHWRGLACAADRIRGRGRLAAVGARTIVREHVTIHRASEPRGNGRRISTCFCRQQSRAHDCQVGDGVTIANARCWRGS